MGGIGDGQGVGGGLEWVCGVGSQEAGAGCTDLSSKSWNKSDTTNIIPLALFSLCIVIGPRSDHSLPMSVTN